MNIIGLIIIIVTMIAICVVIINFIINLIGWSIHIEMTKNTNKPYDFVNFKIFKYYIKEYENYPDDQIVYNKDYFYIRNILRLTDCTIEINDKCMIFYPLGYIRYKIWMKNLNRKYTDRRVKGLWKENKR